MARTVAPEMQMPLGRKVRSYVETGVKVTAAGRTVKSLIFFSSRAVQSIVTISLDRRVNAKSNSLSERVAGLVGEFSAAIRSFEIFRSFTPANRLTGTSVGIELI
jgi:hypothetical protein